MKIAKKDKEDEGQGSEGTQMGWGERLEEKSGIYDVCVCAQQPVVVNLTMRTDEGGFWSLNKVWTAKMSCGHTCLTRLVLCLAYR